MASGSRTLSDRWSACSQNSSGLRTLPDNSAGLIKIFARVSASSVMSASEFWSVLSARERRWPVVRAGRELRRSQNARDACRRRHDAPSMEQPYLDNCRSDSAGILTGGVYHHFQKTIILRFSIF